MATGTRKAGPFNHLDAVFSLAFSPDGRSFVTGCADGTIGVWDPAIADKRSAMSFTRSPGESFGSRFETLAGS